MPFQQIQQLSQTVQSLVQSENQNRQLARQLAQTAQQDVQLLQQLLNSAQRDVQVLQQLIQHAQQDAQIGRQFEQREAIAAQGINQVLNQVQSYGQTAGTFVQGGQTYGGGYQTGFTGYNPTTNTTVGGENAGPGRLLGTEVFGRTTGVLQ